MKQKKKPDRPPRDTHRRVHSTIPVHLLPCRMCGFPAEIWQRWAREDVWYTYVSCSNQEDVDGEECVFAPPDREAFYCERKADAFRYWNLMMGPRPAAPGLNTLEPQLLEASQDDSAAARNETENTAVTTVAVDTREKTVIKNEARKIALAALMIMGEVDSDDEVFIIAEDIKQLATELSL